MTKFYVGIDISKRDFYAAIQINDKEKVKSFPNNEEGFKTFLAWLQTYSIEKYHCGMESTGKYGLPLAEFLHKNDCIVSIINPVKIKFFMKSHLSRNKTDPIDSKYILRFCEYFKPHAWMPEPSEIEKLQELTKRLDALTGMKQQEENRLENVNEIIKKSVHNHIDYLKKEIKCLEKEIKVHIHSYPKLKEQSQLLMSILGVGPKTISKTLTFLSQVEKFKKAKNAASFVGLTPHHFQSGTSLNYSKISRMGNAELRKMLYMPALCAIRHNPLLKAFYEKLISKGKAKKQAICAVMRKLIHIIYGVLKNKKPFDANWSKNAARN